MQPCQVYGQFPLALCVYAELRIQGVVDVSLVQARVAVLYINREVVCRNAIFQVLRCESACKSIRAEAAEVPQ